MASQDASVTVMSDELMLLDPEPKKFTPFCQLPIKIRKKIWALNLPGPRLVEVIFFNNEYHGSAFQVINLMVCRESRQEALKTHPLSFSVNYMTPLIPFNFDTDTLLLSRNLKYPQTFKRCCDEWDLAKVKRLMVDRNIVWGNRRSQDRAWRLGQMSHLIFRGVTDYTCIFTGCTDPLPFWASIDTFPHLQSRYNRTEKYNPHDAVVFLKSEWPMSRDGAIEIPREDCESNRFGGISYRQKYEPSIRYWNVPRVFTMGVAPRTINAFNHSTESSWAEIVMDRAIEDIFD